MPEPTGSSWVLMAFKRKPKNGQIASSPPPFILSRSHTKLPKKGGFEKDNLKVVIPRMGVRENF